MNSSVEEESLFPSSEGCKMEEEAVVLSEKRARSDLSDANLDATDENTSGKRHRTDISEHQSCEVSLPKTMAAYAEAPASGSGNKIDLVVNETRAANLENDTDNIMLIDEQKKLKCELCNIDCNSQKDLKLHLDGKKHRKLVNGKKTMPVNEKPEVPANEEHTEPGIKTMPVNEKTEVPANEEHTQPVAKALAEKENLEDSLNGVALRKEETANKALEQFTCNPCQVNCNSQRDYEQHIGGKKHSARLKKLLVKGANNNEMEMVEKTIQAEHANGMDVSNGGLVGNCLRGGSSSHVAPIDLELATEGGYVSKCAIPNVEAGNSVSGEGVMQVDPSSLEISKRIVIQGHSIDKKLGEYLKTPPTDNEATCFVSALDSMGMLLCPAMWSPKKGTFGLVNSGGPISIETDNSRNEVLYDLCGRDCGKSAEDHACVMMHAGCFLKLLKSAYCSLGVKSPLHSAGLEEMDCKMCRVEFGSKVDLESHMNGKKHAAQVKKMQLRCEVCNINCSSSKAMEAHLAGKAHASKLRLSQKRSIVLD